MKSRRAARRPSRPAPLMGGATVAILSAVLALALLFGGFFVAVMVTENAGPARAACLLGNAGSNAKLACLNVR